MTRVLVIDDDEWLAKLFTRRLEHNGMVAQSAPNAIEALDLIDSFQPEVIILDLFMPGPNGLVLLHELQSHDDRHGRPGVRGRDPGGAERPGEIGRAHV